MSEYLTAEELLAGASETHVVDVPRSLLSARSSEAAETPNGRVVLRPLTLHDIQRVTKAAKEEDMLTSMLMVQQALVNPKMTLEQISGLPAGLVQFLLEHVNKISGLKLDEDDLDRAVKAPIARACFVLAREFGWTPAECTELTLGQVLLYLEMIARGDENSEAGGE